MKIYCQYCGGRHDRGYVCPRKPQKRRDTDTSDAAAFRNTKKWKRKSLAIRERDGFVCRWCLHNRMITHDGISVHHIEPLSENYAMRLADENLISLCALCHTQADSGYISREELKKLAKEPIQLKQEE